MDDLAREIAAIREELNPDWDEARSERLYAGVGRLQRRRRRLQVIGSTSAVALGLAVVVGLQSLPTREDAGSLAGTDVPRTRQTEPTSSDSAPASQPMAAVTRVSAQQRVRLADGSSAVVVSDAGALDVQRNEPGHLELALRSGVARFQVVPNKQRVFRVNAGAVQVFVVGTVFDVERAHGRVRVAVSEGKVRIETPAGSQFVAAGESAWFDAQGARLPQAPAASSGELDRFQESSARARETVAAREPAAKSKRVTAKEDKASAKVSWRTLCQSGDYEEAYRLIESGTPVEDEPAALMDAADAARLSNHPDASVAYLRRVLRDHKKSPVAPLAGFTLGRVLLERLGQPSEAAEAFALARSIAPQGSLAQDALAREVEAWSKAGNSHEAYQKAQLYVQQYPTGRRLRAVRLYGGLD